MMSAPKLTPSSASDAMLAWRVARAEALHVDGWFKEAAAQWQALSEDNFGGWEVPLKAAVSLIAAGDTANGLGYLELAGLCGAPAPAIIYIKAQNALLQRRGFEAYRLLESLDWTKPESADGLALLGVIDAHIRRRTKAIAWTKYALAVHPTHVPALCNALALGLYRDEWRQLLRRAAALAPERREPLLLAAQRSHANSLRVTLEQAADARNRSSLQPHFSPQRADEPIKARARLNLSDDGVRIDVIWTLAVDQPLLLSFRAHASWTICLCTGLTLPRTDDAAAEPACYHLTPADWQRESDKMTLRLSLSSNRNAASVLYGPADAEFEGTEAWLPIPVPYQPVQWSVEVEPSNWFVVASAEPTGAMAVGLVGIREPYRLEGRYAKGVGRVSPIHLARALATVERTFPIWHRLLGKPGPEKPILAVVDKPRSTFCYTRSNLIRAPSGVTADQRHLPILIHEVGHLWWAGNVPFDSNSLWLAEALAEFTLHMAEDIGLVEGYRRQTCDAIAALCLGSSKIKRNLLVLAQSVGAREAYVLRAAGGFMISALALTLGRKQFWRWLKLLASQSVPINAYDAFALAGRLCGHSLNYFVNQWVTTERIPTLETHARIGVAQGKSFRVDLRCELKGVTLPATRFPVSIVMENSERVETSCDLSIAEDDWTVVCSARPLRIEPDPERRWLIRYEPVRMVEDDALR